MTLQFPSEISQESLVEKLTEPNTEKEESSFFASRIIQICSDLLYQPESTNLIDNDFQSSVRVAGSQNAEELDPSWGHYIEVEGPSARAQTSEATPEIVHDDADDVIALNFEPEEPHVSKSYDESDVVEFSGPNRSLNKTPHNSFDASEQEYQTRTGKSPNSRPQIISEIRTYSICSGSDSERKEREPRTDATSTSGMDQTTASQQSDNVKDNVEALSRVVNPEERHGGQNPTYVKAETAAPSQPRKHAQTARPEEPLAESGKETHDQNSTIDFLETGVSTSPVPTKHRARSPNSNYTCTYCGKHQFYNSRLVQHLRMHTGEKPFSCNVCEKRFVSSAHLTVHFRTHTGEKPFPCTLCEKRFASSANLCAHIRTHTGEKPFPCTLCDKRFASSFNLCAHIRTHTGEKPYPCTFCGNRFYSSSQLNTHVRTHTGEKPFPCIFCENRFSSSSQLNTHIRTHTGEKPFGCTMCGKNFARKNSLVDHTRTHTGERPYKCTVCGKGFSAKTNLRRHMGVHPEETRF